MSKILSPGVLSQYSGTGSQPVTSSPATSTNPSKILSTGILSQYSEPVVPETTPTPGFIETKVQPAIKKVQEVTPGIVKKATDIYTHFPTLFITPKGIKVSTLAKEITPQQQDVISTFWKNPVDNSINAARDYLDYHPTALKTLASAQNIIENYEYKDPITKKVVPVGLNKNPLHRGVAQGVSNTFLGSSQQVKDVFDKQLVHPVTIEDKVYDTVGGLIGQIMSYYAGGAVFKALGVGKATLPLLFATLGQTSAPPETTTMQRIEKLPVDVAAGWLFSKVPAFKPGGLSLANLKTLGLGTTLVGGAGGGQGFLDALIMGKSKEDAIKMAVTQAAVMGLFHIVGSGTGLLSDEILNSKIKTGKADFTPEEIRNIVRSSRLDGTQMGNDLMKLATEAETSDKNINIDMKAVQKTLVSKKLDLNKPEGLGFNATLVDKAPAIPSGKEIVPEEKGIVPGVTPPITPPVTVPPIITEAIAKKGGIEVPPTEKPPVETITQGVEPAKVQEIAKKVPIATEFQVGDILDPQGNTNMVGTVTIRAIEGNTLKFVDSKGTEYSGMQRSVVRDLIKGGSWKRVQGEIKELSRDLYTPKQLGTIVDLPGRPNTSINDLFDLYKTALTKANVDFLLAGKKTEISWIGKKGERKFAVIEPMPQKPEMKPLEQPKVLWQGKTRSGSDISILRETPGGEFEIQIGTDRSIYSREHLNKIVPGFKEAFPVEKPQVVAKPTPVKKAEKVTPPTGKVVTGTTKEIKAAAIVTPKRPNLPVLGYVGVKDGEMQVTDLEVAVKMPTDQADGVYDLVGKDLVSNGYPMEELPVIETPTENQGKVLSDGFSNLLGNASMAVSTDETRPILTGIQLTLDKNHLVAVSTDGFRLFYGSVGAKVTKPASMIIGGTKKLTRLSPLMEGVLDINQNKDSVSFGNNEMTAIVRKLEGTFPDYEKIYPQFTIQMTFSKAELADAVKQLAPYAKESANIIKFTPIGNDKMELSATKQEVVKKVVIKVSTKKINLPRGLMEGTLIMPVRLTEEGKGTKDQFSLNYRFVEDYLKTNKENEVFVREANNLSPFHFAEEEKPIIKETVAPAPVQLTPEEKKLKKWIKSGTSGSSAASIGEYRGEDVRKVADSLTSFKAVEFPELVRIVRGLTGEFPEVKTLRFRPTLGGRPAGMFVGKEGGKIILNPDIFRTPEQAVKTFAHEIGHMNDYLPDELMHRGNLLGRIASLKMFLKKSFYGLDKQAKIDELTRQRQDLTDQRRSYTELENPTAEEKLASSRLRSQIVELNKKIKGLQKGFAYENETILQELKKITQMWKPFDEEGVSEGFKKYRYSNPELYADAVSVLFNDPQMLKDNAPTFWKGFFEFLDRKPEAKVNFFATWDLLNKGEGAVLSERDKELGEMFQKGEDLFKTKLLEKRQKENDLVFRLKHELIDKNQRVIDMVNADIKKGIAIPDEDNPVYYLEESNYIGGVVKAWIQDNVQPLYQDLIKNDVSWEDFGKVLFLERVIYERGGTRNPIQMLRQIDNELIEGGLTDFIEQYKDKMPPDLKDLTATEILNQLEKKDSAEQLRWLKTIFGELRENPFDAKSPSVYDELMARLPRGIANPLGYDVETAKKQLEYLKGELGDKFKVIDRNLPLFRKAIKDLIPQAYEAQLYKKKLAEEMIANPGYATYQVLDYLDTYIPASVKHQVGTLKEVSNPAGATILKAISTVRAIEKNKTKLALVNWLKTNHPDEIVDAKTIWTGRTHIPIESKTPDKKMIMLMENGALKGYYVDPYIASTVETAGTGTNNAIIEVFRFLNHKLFKPLFTTYNLGFQTFNFMRDFLRYYKNSPDLSLINAIKYYGTAVKPSIARAWNIPDKTISEMEKKKILGITYNDIVSGMSDEDKQIDLILKQVGLSPLDISKKKWFLKYPMRILDEIANSGNFIESLPKVASYQRLNGRMPSKEMGSFIRRSVGSPDFLSKGAGYPWYNEIFLYSNAIKEGMRSDYHVAVTNPKTRSGYWWKTALINILPKLIMFAGVLGLFGAKIKKMLRDVSEYDKTNYTIVPMGVDKNNMTVYLRIPQDESGRFLSGFLWKVLGLIQKENFGMDDVSQLLSFTGGQLPNVTPELTSLLALTQYLAGTNPYDFFRGRNVIPDTEFKAGGSYALKPFITWQLNTLGLGVFMKTFTTQQAPETRTWVQKVTEAPLLSNILGRWIKVSNYGQTEINRQIITDTNQQSAQESLQRRDLLDKYVTLYQKEKPSAARQSQMEKELVTETLGHPNPANSKEKTTRTNTIKKFRVSILRGGSDVNLNSLIDATTNDAKIEILNNLKKSLETVDYNKLIKVARDNKIISVTVIKEVK